MLFDRRLVVHEISGEDEPLRISARDVFDDRTLWSIERPRAGFNGYMQRWDDEHVIINFGDRLDLIAVADGRVAHSHPYRALGRHVWAERGVCLLNERCTFDLLDCATAKPLRTFRIGRSRRRPLHGHVHGVQCMGGPRIVGRARDVLVLHVDNWQNAPASARSGSFRTGADVWVGIDATRGDVRWTQPHPEGSEQGVHAPFAWFIDESRITVIRTPNGRVHRHIEREPRFVFDLEREPPSIQVLLADSVEVIELGSGRVAERRAIPNRTLAIHADAVYPEYFSMRIGSTSPQQYLWLQPGVEPVAQTIAAGDSLYAPESPGEPWRLGASFESSGFEVERYRTGDSGPPNRARLKRGDDVLAEFDHDAWSLGEAADEERRAIAIFVSGEDWRTDAKVALFRN